MSQILAFFEAKATGQETTLPLPDGSGDEFDRIIAHLVANEERTALDNAHIEGIGLALMAMGARRSHEPVEVHGSGILDALALGVNMLAEELEATTVSLEYLNDVLDSLPDAVFVTTKAKGIHLRNTAATQLAGQEDDVGRLFGELATLDRFDATVQSSDGTMVPVSVVASTLRAGHRVFVARDITSRLALEKEVEDARDAALAASEMKSNFLATMSHEIRTPINGVVGMSQLLSATSLSPSQQEMSTTISTSASALLEIVNDVLDFSKIEAGRLELEHLEFDMVETLGQVLHIHTVAAANAENHLFLHVATDVPILVGDEGRIRQVVNNLISNAIKFTQGGEIVVRMSAEPDGEDRLVVRVEVSDTGIGIALEHANQLFEAFSQADSTIARKYGGTGLGLAICRQLVELMGGEIGVESVVGEGTSFGFSVPLRIARDQALASPPSSLEGSRILVVEPNPTGQGIIEEHLDRWGAECVTIPNGGAALAQLEQHSFDACIIESKLPGVSGTTLAQRIVARTNVPTLLVHSMLSWPGPAKLEARGGWVVMAKPLRPRELQHTLWRMIHRQAPEPSVDAPRPALKGRILIVEDNPVNQKVALAQLKTLGLSADVAANGREAVDAFSSLPYDLILMDVQMPIMDGYEATACIRAIEARTGGHISIVGLTANVLSDERQRTLEVGMDDSLTKPTTLQVLASTLEKWLSTAVVEPAQGGDADGAST